MRRIRAVWRDLPHRVACMSHSRRRPAIILWRGLRNFEKPEARSMYPGRRPGSPAHAPRVSANHWRTSVISQRQAPRAGARLRMRRAFRPWRWAEARRSRHNPHRQTQGARPVDRTPRPAHKARPWASSRPTNATTPRRSASAGAASC